MRRSFLFLVEFTPVFMPALSPSMEKGVIVEWKKKVGDLVMENEVFCSVQTDKALVDYTNTFASGYLAKIYHQNGETVPVTKTIAVMVEEEADVASVGEYTPSDPTVSESPTATATNPIPTSTNPIPTSTPAQAPLRYGASLDEAIHASGPSVVRIASRLDPQTVEKIIPTGKGGRFSKSDFMGHPGFHYEDAPVATSGMDAKSSAGPGNTVTAGVVTQAVPVYNFKVSDTTLLAELIRTMPVPKAAKKPNVKK